MQVMNPHLATHGNTRVVPRSTDREGTSENRVGTATSFRKACLIIAAWLLGLLLVPFLFLQSF
jgi:hypothetical protein